MEIDEEAFTGAVFTFIKLPDNAVRIGPRAFADCPKLTYIVILADVTEIDASAFDGVEGLTIIGVPDTRAETYAQEKNISFLPLV